MSQQPNWLGLLQWSLAYSDGTKESTGKTLSEEDKLWLEQVMREAVTDEPARLNTLVLELTGILEQEVTDANEDKFENGLEEIKGIVEQIDMAQIFAKFGGAKCLMRIIHSNMSNEIKALAASVIGTMAQNNLKVQDILFNEEVVVELMTVYAKCGSPLLCTKLLYAVSCIIRSHPAAELFFVTGLAQPILGHAVSSKHEPLVLRAVFLTNALLSSDSTTHDRIEKLAVIVLPAVLAHFNTTNVDLHENIAALLTTLLHTERGWQMMTSEVSSDVQVALATRRAYIARSSGDAVKGDGSGATADEEEDRLTAEEAAHCTHIVQRLVALMTLPLSVRYPHPHSHESGSTEQQAGGDDGSNRTSHDAAAVAVGAGGTTTTISQDDLRNWQIR